MALDPFLADPLQAFGILLLTKVVWYTWDLGPCQIVYAENVIYSRTLGHPASV